MPSYTGLCIGGPMAGQLFTHDREHFYAANPASYNCFVAAEVPEPSTITHENCVYRWMEGFQFREKRFDFWTSGPMDPVDALNAMDLGYLASCGGDNL